jgi:site-specific DNA-cytosine methylase
MLRVIQELQPAWVIGENVPGILNLALDEVLASLENAEYEAQSFVIPAASVNAWHKRERVCIVAHANNRSGAMFWNGELQAVEEARGNWIDNGGRTQATIARERWEIESRMDRMVARIQSGMDWPDTDTDQFKLEGSSSQKICGGG